METIKLGRSARFDIESPDPAYLHAYELETQGTPWKAITKLTGVGYNGGWVFCRRMDFAKAGTLIDLATLSDTQAQAKVFECRERGESWGLISARCGIPESAVRKAFTTKANVDHHGLRNGRGGRFYQGNAEAYAPAPKVGWVRPTEANVSLPSFIKAGLLKAGVGDAEATEISQMSLKDLRSMAKSLGLPTAGTKKDLAERVGAAFAE